MLLLLLLLLLKPQRNPREGLLGPHNGGKGHPWNPFWANSESGAPALTVFPAACPRKLLHEQKAPLANPVSRSFLLLCRRGVTFPWWFSGTSTAPALLHWGSSHTVNSVTQPEAAGDRHGDLQPRDLRRHTKTLSPTIPDGHPPLIPPQRP